MAKKILFIEDEPDQITLIRARIEASGYDFDSAMDGIEGLKKVEETKPDIVLLDLILPKLNGFEVCRKMKQNPETKGIPVIVLTAIGIKDAEERCRGCGADSFFKKPYDSKALMEEIKKLIS